MVCDTYRDKINTQSRTIYRELFHFSPEFVIGGNKDEFINHLNFVKYLTGISLFYSWVYGEQSSVSGWLNNKMLKANDADCNCHSDAFNT